MVIIKRDGTSTSFDANKIVNAINKAFTEVDGKIYENDTATDIAVDIGRKVDQFSTPVNVE